MAADPYGRNVDFLGRSLYFFFLAAPKFWQLYHRDSRKFNQGYQKYKKGILHAKLLIRWPTYWIEITAGNRALFSEKNNVCLVSRHWMDEATGTYFIVDMVHFCCDVTESCRGVAAAVIVWPNARAIHNVSHLSRPFHVWKRDFLYSNAYWHFYLPIPLREKCDF
jgi:hypothetical protein